MSGNAPKRVLFVATEFNAGMNAFATTVVNKLSLCQDVEVSFLTVTNDPRVYNRNSISEYAKEVAIVVYPTNKFIRFLYKFYPIRFIKEYKKMVKRNYDIIHFLTIDFSMVPWLYVTKNWQSNFFYTVHDVEQHEYNQTFFERLLSNYFFKGSCVMREHINNLNTSSFSQKEKLEKLYPHKNIFYTHAPTVITKPIIEGNEPVKELNNISGYILFFGFVDTYKGVDLLITAYNNSNVKNKRKLVIAGKGGQNEKLSSNVIRLNRFIKDSEVRDLFEKAAFTVFPYRSATQSAITALAFYFKKKAIMSDLPFFLDTKTEDTIFFKTGDSEDLREKLDSIVVSDTNGDSYQQLYSEETLIKDFKKMYTI